MVKIRCEKYKNSTLVKCVMLYIYYVDSEKRAHSIYLNTPFKVPGIKPRLKKIVLNLVSIKYMYKRGTKPETFFSHLTLSLGLKTGY